MKVVFFKDVEGTAQIGDIKDVKPGFARNYLLPRRLAAPTTKDNVQHALALAEREKRVQAKLDAEAEVTAGPLAGAEISVEARVGDSGRLFGSITTRDVAAVVQEAHGVEVDPHAVLLHEPIRELGSQTVTIRFTRNITTDIVVNVVPDEESKEIVARLEAEAEAARIEEEKTAKEEEYRRQHEQPQGGQPGETPADEPGAEADAAAEAETNTAD